MYVIVFRYSLVKVSMKLTYTIFLAFLLLSCSETPKPIVYKPAPAPPPIEESADYWLSHPSIVLLSAKYGVGADTIMDIAYSFNGMYSKSSEPTYLGRRDHTLCIRPTYTGEKGQGPSPKKSRAFFIEQAKLYNLAPKDVSAIISAVYNQGNQFTPRETY